ncbi:hypothetical protein [Rickettsiella massiliensis]|uniref:hypothetical protein n=1 Tax=Rickettsiella massiliensis TaxID=676517 RepID=UPI00178C45ED|nr:hypothetical protein [Rickettsiella massiliensis]
MWVTWYANFIWLKKDQEIAKKVEGYLPREDSQILKVISLLTVLLVKDKLDTLLQTNHGIKYSFDTSKLLTLMNSLLHPFASACSDDITKSWSDQEQAIAKLAKNYANEVFKNLVHYANKTKKDRINNRIFDALIPEFIQNNKSVKTTQDRVVLTAWLGALSMVVSKEYQHHGEFFYSEVEKLRDQVDLSIEQTAMAQEQDLGDQDRTASWLQKEPVEENDNGYDVASLVSHRSSTKSNKPAAPTSTAAHAAFHSNRSTTADSEHSHCSKRSQHSETTHHSAVRPSRP